MMRVFSQAMQVSLEGGWRDAVALRMERLMVGQERQGLRGSLRAMVMLGKDKMFVSVSG